MSEKIELLKCPACGGTLEPQPGQTVMKCPYCNSSVMIPKSVTTPEIIGFHVDPDTLAKIISLARAGKKIEAIKIVRQITEADLSDAKEAVEALERGESIDLSRLRRA